MQVLKQFLWKN